MNKFISNVNKTFYDEYDYKSIMSSYRNRIINLWLFVFLCISLLIGVVNYLYQSVFSIRNAMEFYWVGLLLFISVILFLIYSLWMILENKGNKL